MIERQKNTNKNIDSARTHLNYYIKKNEQTYTKEFDKYLKEKKRKENRRTSS